MNSKIQEQLQTLNRLYKWSDKIHSGIASHFDMNDTAFWVLYAISHADEPLTQNDLCNDWFYPAQTINSAVRSLLKKGLVELEVIPGTKNRKKLLLTQAGSELAKEVIGIVDEIESNAFSSFSEEEREQYLSLFQRHLENLTKEEQRVLDSLNDSKK